MAFPNQSTTVQNGTSARTQHQSTKDGIHLRRREPIVFGVLPGPRQDADGNAFLHTLRDSSELKTTIKFKTSAAHIRTLFPSDNYSFATESTEAIVSYSVLSFSNLAWLGGGGYDVLAVFVHDVICEDVASGRRRKGNYVPVMLENLCDPILTGREELGVGKLFSDIEISKTQTSLKTSVSWRGAKWIEIELNNLQPAEVPPAHALAVEDTDGDTGGMIVHKYIPTTGRVGEKPDADYDVFIVHDPNAATMRSISRTSEPDDVRISIINPGVQKLPTLHPVAEGLSQIPILEILDATVADYQGVPDFSTVERLN